jgi:hypothetical protein
MAAVESVIMSTTSEAVRALPLRSPMHPKNMLPKGRMTNDRANIPNVDKSAAAGSVEGKNCVAMTGARPHKRRSRTTQPRVRE